MLRIEAQNHRSASTSVEVPTGQEAPGSLAKKLRNGLKSALGRTGGRVAIAAALSFAVITGVTPGRALANGESGGHSDGGGHDSGSNDSGSHNHDTNQHVDHSVSNHVEQQVQSEVHHDQGNHPDNDVTHDFHPPQHHEAKNPPQHPVEHPPVHPEGDHKPPEQPALVNSSNDSSGGDIVQNDCSDSVKGPLALSTVSKDHLDCAVQTPEVINTIIDPSEIARMIETFKYNPRGIKVDFPAAA